MLKLFAVVSLVVQLQLVPPVTIVSPCYPMPADSCEVNETPVLLKYKVFIPIANK